jgi:hypothetical protein
MRRQVFFLTAHRAMFGLPMTLRFQRLIPFAFVLLAFACAPPSGDDTALDNLPPQTHLSVGFFRADSTAPDTLGLTSSRVGLAWWGEDADGWIDHYEYRWQNDFDSLGQPSWHRTDVESDTFIVHLDQDTMLVKFEVRAFDNRGSMDLSPAATTFPAYNQKPKLDWVAQSQEMLNGAFDADTSWTFPYNSFHFNVWDLDGNETISEVVWALDDTTTWATLEPGLTSIRLDPELLSAGPHRIFVKAKDIVNAWSDLLMYPRLKDTTDTGEDQIWMVSELGGDLLLVLDNIDASVAEPYLKEGLAGMGYQEGENYTYWHAANWMPYDTEDIVATFDEFAMIFWASWKQTQMEDVCESLDRYQATGGHLLITTTDVGGYSTYSESAYLYDGICVPIDSLTNQRHHIFNPVGSFDHPITPSDSFLDRYPTLYTTERITFKGNNPNYDPDFGFVPDDSCAVELFFVPEDPEDPERFPRVTVGARTAAPAMPEKAQQVYLSLPLWKLDDLPALFEVLIYDEFNW